MKKPKKEGLSIRKRLELKFGRKGSEEKEKAKETSPPPKSGEERIEPWRSTSAYRAEPRVLHGMRRPSLAGSIAASTLVTGCLLTRLQATL